MANIKPIDLSAKKWNDRSSMAGPDWVTGVKNPRRSWAQSSADAEGNWKTGVNAAATAGRFGVGVKRAGDAKWQANSEAKQDRFASGVQLAVAEWQRGFQPYQEAIKALNLPVKGPRRSAANLQRVAAVMKANGDLKERLASGK